MPWKLKWTPSANRDLLGIHTYLLRRQPDAVDRVLNAIHSATYKLRQTPHVGDIDRNNVNEVVREIVAASYRIFFVVREEWQQVEVIKLWHSARAEPDLDDFIT